MGTDWSEAEQSCPECGEPVYYHGTIDGGPWCLNEDCSAQGSAAGE